MAIVGGCCAPTRHKTTGFLYQDDGSTYKETGNKIVAITDRPLVQNITISGWYMKNFVDDGAVNLTIIPTINHPDKQSILYEIVAFDRAMLITYQFYDSQNQFIGNHSSGIMRNTVNIQDITLPKYTRRITVAMYSSRADPMCFSYIYSGLYVHGPFTTLVNVCAKMTTLLQYISLANFLLIPIVFAIMAHVSAYSFPPPSRFLCRAPSNKVHMCIIVMLGSFISNQAWNMLNSQSTMFHDWLPRAVKIIELFLSFLLYAVYFYPLFLCYHASYRSRVANIAGAYTTLTLFGLRVSVDLPVYTITYARSQGFLIINLIATIPTIAAFFAVALYFTVRSARNHDSFSGQLWEFLTVDIWKFNINSIDVPDLLKQSIRYISGLNEFVRIPFAIKASLILLLYCLAQLIPLLLTRMLGTGGVVPTHICLWSPYLVQFHYNKDPLEFAIRTFYFMRIVVYLATLGGGGFCMIFSLGILRRFTKDILRIRKGDYSLVKGKRHNRALTSYFLRTLKSILRYPMYSLRVDRNAETWSVRNGDAGFTAYCGMLLTDHEYNNPVVVVFVECILDCIEYSTEISQYHSQGKPCRYHYKTYNKALKGLESERNEENTVGIGKDILISSKDDCSIIKMDPEIKREKTLSSKRARNRWFLAYTLVNNPQVSQYIFKRKLN
ncbi:hypothetical protein G6F29_000647 [Rhizopus arrhizus]|uniref:Receptor for retinol uptake STRA6 n=1 Tax=Rhizopus oryzae TaxID=64495 RepID=A0A9P7BUH5_RHIOR|nr:hypothetical protein G6F24_006857 [Rhizopus arrhizus]KAG0939509.1 hypothetical protein G6F30_007210 [Rhizopus arrhizus]KAG0989893.1 hypothetical protein G6F29_000647 [Rhizopus arrhizus]KAG0999986.1 hypothetical protein G6F28_000482 [Rhizopus arrhizus]KAG1015486.1 hypothetical protein G6F27_000029 [Rhizopus arrhizus]